MTKPRVLVVDDDTDTADMLKTLLEVSGMEAEACYSGEESLTRVGQSAFDLVLTDVSMNGMDGLTLCKRLLASAPDVPVIVVTGHASMESAVKALRVGAYDYLPKPVEPDILLAAVRRALDNRLLRAEVRRLQAHVSGSRELGGLVFGSRTMQQVLTMVDRVAATDATVLVTGESGTGKELIARTVHERSVRKGRPFVALNCAAIPHHLIESELFGHARGAFTDARNARVGMFQEADGGTLFLDEIGEMPIEMQAKLLRALQERTVRPVGSNTEVAFNTRIIAATNRDLETEIHERRFREDLYYRIAGSEIHLPALRERPRDIVLIAQGLLAKFAESFGKDVQGFTDEALECIANYRWPGNVRELHNEVQRMVALCDGERVGAELLSPRVIYAAREEAQMRDLSLLAGLDGTLKDRMDQLEARVVKEVMVRQRWNKTRAADELGLSRVGLRSKLSRYGLDKAE